jgi:oligosaccharyltransferase complex subunit beta
MMDPYVRKNMVADSKGKFSALFTAPDDYGIFKFRVLYRRPGYSILHAETKVSLRPYKHNEYDRFLLPAYPYYFSALSCMAAFLIFSLFFLYSDDDGKLKTH